MTLILHFSAQQFICTESGAQVTSERVIIRSNRNSVSQITEMAGCGSQWPCKPGEVNNQYVAGKICLLVSIQSELHFAQ